MLRQIAPDLILNTSSPLCGVSVVLFSMSLLLFSYSCRPMNNGCHICICSVCGSLPKCTLFSFSRHGCSELLPPIFTLVHMPFAPFLCARRTNEKLLLDGINLRGARTHTVCRQPVRNPFPAEEKTTTPNYGQILFTLALKWKM